MGGDDPVDERPWRRLRDAEGRAARLDALRALRDERLDTPAIAARMEVAQWVVERDLEAIESEG